MIDENLYSRQLYVLGRDAMKKMGTSSVLISGLGGLGVEIAKNVILSGVKQVVVHDTTSCTIKDMSSNYYMKKSDIGLNRAEVCVKKLAELNSYVNVSCYMGDLTDDYLKNFTVVVVTNFLLNEQIRINKFTHDNDIKFISTSTHGLTGQIFCDFGEEFLIKDVDGEQPRSSIIEHITKEKNAIVRCVESEPHDMTTDCVVKFSKIKSMDELNGKECEIEYINPISFRIKHDTTNYNDYTGGSIINQVKITNTVNFKTLEESMETPEFNIVNFLDFDRPHTLHASWLALNELLMSRKQKKNDILSIQESKFLEIVKKYHSDANNDVVHKFLHCLNGDLCPMQAIIGGIVAQEVMKGCSGKFTPINQWLYFDAFDCLPEDFDKLDTKSNGTRYDGQISVFGKEFQQKLWSEKYFLVGAGAIGCELLKNFAMIGLGCTEHDGLTGSAGEIVVTDMDTIEKSNLNRQFLFRDRDIGKAKSTCVAEAVKRMNPDINIIPHENRVGPENEHIYNQKFFESRTGIANALDNIQARLYVDNQCVRHKKSLLESGTLGTKGNVQVIVPHLTESYGSSTDPVEQEFPVCTIKHFPYKIEHTIQFARDNFEGEFNQGPMNAIKYIKDPNYIKTCTPTEIIMIGESILKVLNNIPKSFEDCISWAYKCWHKDYRNDIEQLLHQFPSDAKTKEGGDFWSGTKKCPISLKFNINDDIHIDYIVASANMWGYVFGFSPNRDKNFIKGVVSTLKPRRLIIDENNKKIEETMLNEEQNKSPEVIDVVEAQTDAENILDSLKNLSSLSDQFNKVKIFSADFEKDDDTNFHIDYVTACSNMRALNYGIKVIDKHETKGVAGKIIPAIATTTSIVAGFVTLELYKLVMGFKDIERFNNVFLNLAIPYFGSADPIACPVTNYKDKKYTQWDSFEVRGDMTLQDLVDHFDNKYDIELEAITHNSFMMYSSLFATDKMTKRMDCDIKEILENQYNKKFDEMDNVCTFTIMVDEDECDDEIDLPDIKYYFA
jgi:ubiquitin-activating enzyme E1